jgi:hypothetical protein
MITARDLRTDPVFRASRIGALQREATLTGRSFAVASEPGLRLRLTVDANGALPKWVDSALSAIEDLARLSDGWDSYGARPISVDSIVRFFDVMNDLLLQFERLQPNLVPTAAGGIQVEFHAPGEEMELSITPEKMTVFYQNEARGVSWEGDFNEHRVEVHEVLERMAK